MFTIADSLFFITLKEITEKISKLLIQSICRKRNSTMKLIYIFFFYLKHKNLKEKTFLLMCFYEVN